MPFSGHCIHGIKRMKEIAVLWGRNFFWRFRSTLPSVGGEGGHGFDVVKSSAYWHDLRFLSGMVMLQKLTLCLCLFAVTATGGSGRIEISQSMVPMVISNAGSYVLTESLVCTSGDGITISTDHVSLDLNGFTLQGNPGGHGIAVSGSRKALRVHNGAVANWGDRAIRAGTADHSVFENLRISGNAGDGLNVGNGCLIRNVVSWDNGGGGIRTQNESLIIDSASRNNASNGVQVLSGCVVQRVTARENTLAGIQAGDLSLVLDSSTRGNLKDGIQAGSGSAILASTAYENSKDGFRFSGEASLARDNTAYNNGEYGFRLGAYALFQENASRLNGNGVLVTNFSYVVDNIVDSSAGGSGIHVVGNGSRIDRNHSEGNQYGFLVSAPSNLVVRNTGAANTISNYSFTVTGNNYEIVVNPGTTDSNFDEPWASFDLQ